MRKSSRGIILAAGHGNDVTNQGAECVGGLVMPPPPHHPLEPVAHEKGRKPDVDYGN